MYTNEEFLDLLYNARKIPDDINCINVLDEYNEYDMLFSNRRDLLPSHIRPRQTQIGNILDIQNQPVQKIVYWKDCNSLKDFGLSAFDIEVYNAACSLYIALNEYVSPGIIYRVLSGNSKALISPKMGERITQSLNRLMNTSTVDENNKSYSLLSFSRVDNIKFYEKPAQDCIKINEVPIILVLARKWKALDCDDVKLFNTWLSNTAENIALRGYMFRYIKSIKNSKRIGDFEVPYEALWKYMEIATSNPRATQRKFSDLQYKVERCLLHHWASTKFIKLFTEGKKKYRAIAATSIITL